jgi:hypothetical protein
MIVNTSSELFLFTTIHFDDNLKTTKTVATIVKTSEALNTTGARLRSIASAAVAVAVAIAAVGTDADTDTDTDASLIVHSLSYLGRSDRDRGYCHRYNHHVTMGMVSKQNIRNGMVTRFWRWFTVAP